MYARADPVKTTAAAFSSKEVPLLIDQDTGLG
jgi:hypothetical protein